MVGNMNEDSAGTPLPLRVPQLPHLTSGPVVLRPLLAEDTALAFALAAEAVRWPAVTECGELQAQWDEEGRDWSAWLLAHAGTSAWAATLGADGPLVGFARVVRDHEQQIEQLTDCFVRPAFQGGKVGQALLEAVLPRQIAPGWWRGIVAHPHPAALALYHRWYTLPATTAWHLSLRRQPAASPWHAALDTARAGFAVTALDATDDLNTGELNDELNIIEHLDLPVLGYTRTEQLRFMVTTRHAVGLIALHDGAVVGYGMRSGAAIGPIVGATPEAGLALFAALCDDAYAAGLLHPGAWIPGANTAILAWLAAHDIATYLGGQVQLLCSQPSRLRWANYVLTAPPYVF